MCAVGLIFASRDLLRARRRRAGQACSRCGRPYDPVSWPTRSIRVMEGGPFASVHVCPRCGEPWSAVPT